MLSCGSLIFQHHQHPKQHDAPSMMKSVESACTELKFGNIFAIYTSNIWSKLVYTYTDSSEQYCNQVENIVNSQIVNWNQVYISIQCTWIMID
jgi:uncharacterized protein (UPF0333 family)